MTGTQTHDKGSAIGTRSKQKNCVDGWPSDGLGEGREKVLRKNLKDSLGLPL
jgi:hypothetical protein